MTNCWIWCFSMASRNWNSVVNDESGCRSFFGGFVLASFVLLIFAVVSPDMWYSCRLGLNIAS